MADVWWGLVEQRPNQYNWSAYQGKQINDNNSLKLIWKGLVTKLAAAKLKFQATISFHKCGTNVGDECFIPLPSWITSVGNSNPDIYYTDIHGNRDVEYISLGVDKLPLFAGRAPVTIYRDFVASFLNHFKDYLSTIQELQISLGPAGELRSFII